MRKNAEPYIYREGYNTTSNAFVYLEKKDLPKEVKKITDHIWKVCKKFKARPTIHVEVDHNQRYEVTVQLGHDWYDKYPDIDVEIESIIPWDNHKKPAADITIVSSQSPTPKHTIGESMKKSYDSGLSEVSERKVANIMQRRKQALAFRRNKSRVKQGAKRQAGKMADGDRLLRRGKRDVRASMFRKFSRGKSKSSVSLGQRVSIDTRIQRMARRINMLAKRMVPKLRKQDITRRSNRNRPAVETK